MLDWLLAFLAGGVTGVLSGFGIGGGSLLLIYLTNFAGVAQRTAQGINLLYFLPAATGSLPAHFRNGFVEKSVLIPAIVGGLVTSALAAWISTGLDMTLLRRLFGLFLLYVGFTELFRKN